MRKIKAEIAKNMLGRGSSLVLHWSGANLYEFYKNSGGLVSLYNGDYYLFDDWKDASTFYRKMRNCDDWTEDELKERLKDAT